MNMEDTIRSVLSSPNVLDANCEPANLVDTTQFIANGIVKGACIIAAAIVVHRDGAQDPAKVIRIMAEEIRYGRP